MINYKMNWWWERGKIKNNNNSNENLILNKIIKECLRKYV